jgi:hypothetical protein
VLAFTPTLPGYAITSLNIMSWEVGRKIKRGREAETYVARKRTPRRKQLKIYFPEHMVVKHGRDEEDKRRYPSSKFMRLGKDEEDEKKEIQEDGIPTKRRKATKVLEGVVFVVVDLMDDAHHWKEEIKMSGGSVTSVLSKKVLPSFHLFPLNPSPILGSSSFRKFP